MNIASATNYIESHSNYGGSALFVPQRVLNAGSATESGRQSHAIFATQKDAVGHKVAQSLRPNVMGEEWLVPRADLHAAVNDPLGRGEFDSFLDSQQWGMPVMRVFDSPKGLSQPEEERADHTGISSQSIEANNYGRSLKKRASITDSACCYLPDCSYVGGSTSFSSQMAAYPGNVDSFCVFSSDGYFAQLVPIKASDLTEVCKPLPQKGDKQPVSTMCAINDDYEASTFGDDEPNHFMAFNEERPAQQGSSPANVIGSLSNVNTGSYSQQWRMCLKKVSHSWQGVVQPEEKIINKHGNLFPVADYDEIISGVLNIAKGLSKDQTLQEHLQHFSGRIDHWCGNAILYKLQKERLFLSAFSFFDWMRHHVPCLLNSRSLSTIFTILGDAHMADMALVLYGNLKQQKELWCVQVFNALLSTLSKHYRYDQALAVFQDMLGMKIQPDKVTFSITLNLAHKSGSKAEVLWHIFAEMEKRKVFAGHEAFGVLIKGFCQEGLRDEALQLLAMMEGRGLIPNVVIYNTLIGAFAKAALLESAEGLVSEMTGKGIGMTVVTYNILIDAYASMLNFEVAERILQGMLEKGPRPNVQSFTSLIAAYGRDFHSEKAANVFLRMRKNGIFPNMVAYTALIHAYAEDGWHIKAELAFENMVREGFQPTVETYTSLLHAYRQAGDLEKVKNIWKRMRLEINIGTRETFNVLMDACAKQGDYAEARNIMYVFKKSGYKPDTKIYNILIHAYARGGQHSKTPELLEEMKNSGIKPDSFTYTTLIYSFLRIRDFSQAFEYHDKMCEENQLPDRFTYKKLRALLGRTYEAKAERNMKAVVGIQRQNHEVKRGKKTKSFRKK